MGSWHILSICTVTERSQIVCIRRAVLFPDVVFRFAATDEKTIALTF